MADKIENSRYKRVVEFFSKRWYPNNTDELAAWRELVLAIIYSLTAVFVIFSLVPNISISVENQNWADLGIYIALYVIWLVIILVRRIPYKARVWAGVTTYYLTGLFSLLSLGPVGSGRSYLIAAGLVVSLLLGIKQGMALLVWNVATMFVVGRLFNAGFLTWDHLTDYTWSAWNANFGSFVMFSTVTTISVAVLIRRIELKLRQEQELNTQLALSKQRLVKEIDEHEKAKAELQEQRAFLRQVVDTNPNYIYVMNREGQFTLVNQSLASRYNESADALTGKRFEDILLDDKLDEALVAENIKVIDDLQEMHIPETTNIFPLSEKTHWLSINKRPIINADGRSHQALVVMTDITERVRAAESLRDSEERYRSFVQNFQGIAFRGGMDFVPVFFHGAVEEITGYTEQDFLDGQPRWDQVIHPEDLSALINNDAEKLRSIPHYANTREYRIIRKDNTIRWVYEIIQNICDDSGKLVYLQGMIYDNTSRKLVEEALQASEANYRSVIEDSPGLICRFLPGGVLTFVNEAYAQLFNKKPEELVGINFLPFVVEEDRDRIITNINSLTREEPLITHEESFTLPDGDVRRVRWTNRALFDDQGEVKEVQSFGVDITASKQLEAQLMGTQKMAALGTLAAGIAHEMNSPLQVISGKADSLLRRIESGKLRTQDMPDDLKMISRNSWRLAEVVRSLLNSTRPSSGEMELQALNMLVSDTLLLIEHQLNTWSNIKVIAKLAPDLPDLICDREGVTQILINLLLNARDAMPNGGKIHIRTYAEQGGERLLLEVEDSGKGIPEDVQMRMFDPFFTTKPVGKGTGLGLAIILNTVQAHGGEVAVESHVNQGTTFTVYLPIRPPEAPEGSLIGKGRYDKPD